MNLSLLLALVNPCDPYWLEKVPEIDCWTRRPPQDHVKILNPDAVVPLYAPTTPKPLSSPYHRPSTTYSPYSAQPSVIHHSTTAAPYHYGGHHQQHRDGD